MAQNPEAKLAAPGAGLPLPELMIGKLLFALKRWTGNRELFDRHFKQQRAAIRAILDQCDPITLSQRVHIARPPGLEDSSRYWSILMTLDHLRIVHHEFIRVMTTLANDAVPKGEASKAAVKPDPMITADALQTYEASCDALLAAVSSISDLKTKLRFAHPWFGAMDAYGWHALAGGHMNIHRIQIERIILGLKNQRNTLPLPTVEL
jgi:uncharacterized damage-inducible protein DinB